MSLKTTKVIESKYDFFENKNFVKIDKTYVLSIDILANGDSEVYPPFEDLV